MIAVEVMNLHHVLGCAFWAGKRTVPYSPPLQPLEKATGTPPPLFQISKLPRYHILVTEQPRLILLNQPVKGYSRIVFDEDSEGSVYTITVSKNGFPPGGPPLKPGDAIEGRGQAGETGELIADVIWLMDTEPECE